MTPRTATLQRRTKETDISVRLDLDGTGAVQIDSGIGFLDHLLTALALHARWDLELTCRGDLEVDDHHTAEDCALVLGAAFDAALGDRAGVTRFGTAFAPLDEALARAVVDLATRPGGDVDLGLTREALGALACENIPHVVRSFAQAGRLCVHLDVLKGANDHHRAEAGFKALALALRQAATREVGGPANPSTKGVL